jgi:hypothetical protein
MSAPTEQEIRDNIAKWSVGREHRVLPWTQKRFAFLLDLLDAERAKVKRAETERDRWYGMVLDAELDKADL